MARATLLQVGRRAWWRRVRSLPAGAVRRLYSRQDQPLLLSLSLRGSADAVPVSNVLLLSLLPALKGKSRLPLAS